MNTDSSIPTLHGAAELTHWGLLRAQGKDAASFLHGQLSNDFKLLDTTQTRLAAFCSAKGRMLASFLGWLAEPGDVWLACHQSVLAATLKRLSMFVLRADCRLSDAQSAAPTRPRIWGLAGEAATSALSAAGNPEPWGHRRLAEGDAVIHLPPVAGRQRALWIGPNAPEAPSLPLNAWRWMEVQSGIPLIEQATVEQFVPQMINFELIGGINFKKGCYPGQEVVARSQYRGTAKRRTFLFEVDADAQPGQEVFHPEDPGQPAGLVVNSAPRLQGGGSLLLAEVKLAALAGPSLRLSRADGPILSQQPLPYEVPIDAESAA